MPEWQVEEGIAEHRALCFDAGRVTAAMIDWPGQLAAGQVEDAVLVFKPKGTARGRAVFNNGEEALVDRLPPTASEGAQIRLLVTRAQIGERGRVKLAQARPAGEIDLRPAPTLLEMLTARGQNARTVRRFSGSDWDEIWAEAWSGRFEFAEGSLQFSTTPAMTLIDVDGHAPVRQLCTAAAKAIGAALPRYDLRGSLGIDFPTLEAKVDRRAVDQTLDAALAGWPHERTAMNGFGFVQIVSRMERPSLLHLLGGARAGAAARHLLRRACADLHMPGNVLLTCHPAVAARLKPEWMAELGKITAREARIETDPALALEAGFAQAIAR